MLRLKSFSFFNCLPRPGNWYLRAYVDKEGGITLDDCELVNRAWSDLMDENDFIPEAYILEVSSPGLNISCKTQNERVDFAVHSYSN